MNRRLILFFAKNPHNVVVYNRVLSKLASDPRVELFLTSKNETHHPAAALFDPFPLPGAKRIHYRWAAWKKFDLYLSPDMYLLSRRSRVSVHTFHGISIKGQAFSEKALAFDRLFLIGPYQRRRFAELGVLGEDDPRFANIGMPKLDAFFDGSLVRENYLARHRLDPAKPTILYAPTWRPEASLYSVGEALIRTMREMPWNFMVKLHDLSLDTATNRIDWRQKMRELAAPNIAFIEELDATAALHAADLLISDASSVANEFTLLDRPLVFVEVPDLFKKYGKTIDLENWGQSSGAVARTVPEILERAKQALANPDEFAAPRRRIASEGFYNPGRATQAALDEIYRLIDLDPPAGN